MRGHDLGTWRLLLPPTVRGKWTSPLPSVVYKLFAPTSPHVVSEVTL